MPTRRLPDGPDGCPSFFHNPPRLIVPGTYEHTCPRCERTVTFVVEARRPLVAARHVESEFVVVPPEPEEDEDEDEEDQDEEYEDEDDDDEDEEDE